MISTEATLRYFDRESLVERVDELIARGIVESKALELIDDHFVETVNKWDWKQETHGIPGLGVSFAFYGEHIIGPDQKKQNALNRLGDQYTDEEIPAVADDVSFPELYQISQGLTEPQYMLIQQLVSQELIRASYENVGVTADDVDLFIITCSIPLEEQWAEKIAKTLGIPLEKMIIYHFACASSGGAIFDVHNHVYDAELSKRVPGLATGKPAVISCLAIEDANGLTGKADPLSTEFFSTASAATTFLYSPVPEAGPMTLVTGAQRDVQEGSEYLQYSMPYTREKWPNYREKYTVVESQFLRDPGEGWVVYMDGKNSGTYFRMNAEKISTEVLTNFAEQVIAENGENFKFTRTNREGEVILDLSAYAAMIKKVILHHPSVKIFESLGGRLTREDRTGFHPEQLQFVIPEGNAPSVTIPAALGRQIEDSEFGEGLKDGDLFMILSFGAGGRFTCAIYKYRCLPPKQSI